MSELQIIRQQEVLGQDFRVYGDIENPLFLAKDVAAWIEHSQADVLVKAVDEDEKVLNIIQTPGGPQQSWFLTEDGLYEVLMQSRKPIAKAFKKEVKAILKQIRLGVQGINRAPAQAQDMHALVTDITRSVVVDVVQQIIPIITQLTIPYEQPTQPILACPAAKCGDEQPKRRRPNRKRSKIDRLPVHLQKVANAMFAHGDSYEKIREFLIGQGVPISVSAIWRQYSGSTSARSNTP